MVLDGGDHVEEMATLQTEYLNVTGAGP